MQHFEHILLYFATTNDSAARQKFSPLHLRFWRLNSACSVQNVMFCSVHFVLNVIISVYEMSLPGTGPVWY